MIQSISVSAARRISTACAKSLLVLGTIGSMACLSGASSAGTAPTPTGTGAAGADPRVGLRAGRMNAGEAAWNMRLVAHRPTPEGAAGAWNSDLAFLRNYVLQGNYNGFVVWDISNPANPTVVRQYLCPASQSDVSVYKNNLLFVRSEEHTSELQS